MIYNFFLLIFIFIMKKLSSEKLFSLFDQMDEEVLIEEGYGDLLKEDSILLGMAVKGVENYWYIHEIYLNKYGENYEVAAERIKYNYFNKLYSYVKTVKLNKLEPLLDLIQIIGEGTVYQSLNELLLFFQEYEEYEKCAFIKKILDIFDYFKKN